MDGTDRTGWEAVKTAILDAERQMKEPALANSIGAVIVTALGSGLTLGATYGLDVGGEKGTQIANFIAALIPLVAITWAAFKTRANVWSQQSVNRLTGGNN